jgi:hypothetical protein
MRQGEATGMQGTDQKAMSSLESYQFTVRSHCVATGRSLVKVTP